MGEQEQHTAAGEGPVAGWGLYSLGALELLLQNVGGIGGAALVSAGTDPLLGASMVAGGVQVGGAVGGLLRRWIESTRRRAVVLASALSDEAK